MVPDGQFGRLPNPMRIGVRVKPWKLKRHSSPADGASAEGFGVPVMFDASARLGDEPGAGTPDAGKGGGSPPDGSAAGAGASPPAGAGGGNPPVDALAGAEEGGGIVSRGGGATAGAAGGGGGAVWACPVRDTTARAPASRTHRGVARIAIPLLEWSFGGGSRTGRGFWLTQKAGEVQRLFMRRRAAGPQLLAEASDAIRPLR